MNNSNINEIDKNFDYSKQEQQNIKHRMHEQNLEAWLMKTGNKKVGFFKMVGIFSTKYRMNFGFLFYFIVTNAILIASISFLTNIVIQQALFDQNPNVGQDYGMIWWKWMIITFCALIVLAFGTFMKDFIGNIIAIKIEVDLRNLLIQKLLKQDISYYYDKKIGELVTKIISDTNVIGNEINGLLSSIIQAPLVLIFGSVALFLINPLLAGISIGLVYFMALFLLIIVKSYRSRIYKMKTIITDINGDVTDKIGAIKLVKSSGTRLYENQRIREIHKPYIENNKPVARIGGLLLMVLTASDVIISLVIISTAVYMDNKNGTATYMAFLIPIISGLTALTRPLWQISGIIPGISRASASSQRIFEVTNKSPFLDDHLETGIILNEPLKEIEFKDVSFSYPEKSEELILPNTNLLFESGKSYAFVGETGSGKSTISKLLLRFYDPTIGSIFINGKDLKELNMKSFLENVGYVEQEPSLIYGTVIENVKYGNFDVSDEAVFEACKKANIHDLIMSWPEGYDTVLGERGFLLSGGQKQRIVISRIILKNPELLILDEATSALDNIVEKEIQLELEKIMKNKTTIIIAHRLSTIRNVDKIYVLSKGNGIIQSGTFNELIKADGQFKKLYEASKMEH